MNAILHRGHTISTNWHPIPELGNWPLDHVFVSTEQGHTWGCFGRALQGEPAARVVCQGYANVEWVMEIAGPDCNKNNCGPLQCNHTCCAGVEHQVTGVCHCCANRLLLPAGVDVHEAPGNEVVVPIFGKYGLGIREFVTRVKDTAFRVNSRTPNAIPESQVEAAVQRIMRAREDEYDIMMSDVDDFLHVKVPMLPSNVQDSMKAVYSGLYDRRLKTYDTYTSGQISKDQYLAQMHQNIEQAFHDLQDLLGGQMFKEVFRMPPPVAAAYLFRPQP